MITSYGHHVVKTDLLPVNYEGVPIVQPRKKYQAPKRTAYE